MNLERLGNITAELTSSLVRSIMVPGRWFGRRQRATTGKLTHTYLPGGMIILLGDGRIPEDAVVSTIHQSGGRDLSLLIIAAEPPGRDEFAAGCNWAFKRFGVYRIEAVSVGGAPDNDGFADAIAGKISAADAVCICGADRLAIYNSLNHATVMGALHQSLVADKTIIGVGSGAAALAEWTAAQPGLELLPGLSVMTGEGSGQPDSHALGLYINPEGGVVIQGSEARVIGEGTVSFMEGDGRVQLLEPGQGLDLRTRRQVIIKDG